MKKLLLLLLIYTGCETIVEIDIPEDEPRLVLNSFFNPDSVLSVYLFQSLGVLETGDFKAISNATISIYDAEGVKKTELTDAGSGLYKSSFKPEPGEKYRVKASKSGFDSIESTDIIPQDSARATSIEVNIAEAGFEGSSYSRYNVNFTIQDYAGDDFYEVQILERSVYEYDGIRNEYISRQFLETEDAVFDEFNSSGLALIFSDALFDGGSSTITVNSYLNLGQNCELEPECIEQENMLIIRKVSEAYFRYNRTLRLQQELEGNPFAEPVSVFNNITNGFGVFAGYRNSVFLLEDPED